MTNIEKQTANYLEDDNNFIKDYHMLNDTKFEHKYNATKDEAINDRVLTIQNRIVYYLGAK